MTAGGDVHRSLSYAMLLPTREWLPACCGWRDWAGRRPINRGCVDCRRPRSSDPLSPVGGTLNLLVRSSDIKFLVDAEQQTREHGPKFTASGPRPIWPRLRPPSIIPIHLDGQSCQKGCRPRGPATKPRAPRRTTAERPGSDGPDSRLDSLRPVEIEACIVLA